MNNEIVRCFDNLFNIDQYSKFEEKISKIENLDFLSTVSKPRSMKWDRDEYILPNFSITKNLSTKLSGLLEFNTLGYNKLYNTNTNEKILVNNLTYKSLDNFNKLELINKCKIVNENIDSLLEKTVILISSGPTGVIFESLIYGCKLFYLVLDPSDLLMFKNVPSKNKKYILIKNKDEL